jgi:tripartite-type tricarboxylate transporter receptor subunit TctC
MTRLVTTKMSELLGQQFVIDNRTGAGGIIGGEIVAHASPDGYTLLAAATASQIIGPHLYKKVPSTIRTRTSSRSRCSRRPRMCWS